LIWLPPPGNAVITFRPVDVTSEPAVSQSSREDGVSVPAGVALRFGRLVARTDLPACTVRAGGPSYYHCAITSTVYNADTLFSWTALH
jgi:hypothetical protein